MYFCCIPESGFFFQTFPVGMWTLKYSYAALEQLRENIFILREERLWKMDKTWNIKKWENMK